MYSDAKITVYTIGHSTHPIDRFLDLLVANNVTAVADVRSSPFSRHNPQFNKDVLRAALFRRKISYVFVGKELGARSDDPCCYVDGQVQYDRLAETELFKSGIERVMSGARKFRVALMCAEKEPLDCHRTLLVSRALESKEASIVHILSDGTVEPQAHTMSRLLNMMGLPQEDMFRSHKDLVDTACKLREQKIAYVEASHVGQVNP